MRLRRLDLTQSIQFAGSAMPPAAGLLFGLLNVQLVASRAGVEAVGLLALAQAVSAIVIQLAFGPLSQGLLRFAALPDIPHAQLIAVVRPMLSASGLVLVMAAAALALAGSNAWAIAGLIQAAFYAWILCTSTLAFGAGRRVAGGVIGCLEPVARYIVNVVLLPQQANEQDSLMTFAAATVALGAVPLILAHLFVGGPGHHTAERSLRVSLVTYAWPFVLWGGVAALGAQADRFILAALLSPVEVAYYAVSVALTAGSWGALSNATSNYISSTVYGAGTSDGSAALLIGRVQRFFFALLMLSSLVFVPLAPPIFDTLLNVRPEYSRSILVGTNIAAALFQIGQLSTLLGQRLNRPQRYIVPKIVFALCGVLFAFLGCLTAGVIGVVVAGCISAAIYVALVRRANARLTS